nr:DUF4270 family protein [Allomuricauda sp.]
MKRILALIFPAMALLSSCESENHNSSDFLAGEDFTDSNIRVVMLDTLSVEISTMKFDSIITSGSSRMLIGKYTDTVFGIVRASSFSGLIPSSYTIDSEAEYDSISLYLKPDKYYYSDTLKTNKIHIKRVTKTLRPFEGDDLYNSSTAEYSNDNLGFLSYTPRPMDADTLEIKISDELGFDLFEKFQNKTITSNDQFRDYFKGIALLPGETDNGAIVGFSKSNGTSFMRLYYSLSEESDRVQSYIDFALDLSTTPVPFFNQITADNPIAALQTLTDEEVNLSCSDSGNRSFVQSGIGMATRIQFPHIKTIYDIPGEGTILDAVLKIRPATASFDEKLILKDTLSVYVVDQNNDLIEQLLYAGVSPVKGILNKKDEEFNNVYYEIPIGSYIEKLLLEERDTGEALILLPDDYNSTVDRFILNGTDNSAFSTVLELTYAIYDENDE